MQAIDEQVDHLASAAGKALGSFWTGLGGALNTGMQAASNIAGQIETAAVQAANRVTESTKEHVPWYGAPPDSSKSFHHKTRQPLVHSCFLAHGFVTVVT